MSFSGWNEVFRELTRGLETLGAGEFLVLGESDSTTARRGIFARRSVPSPARYVQALRISDLFSAECVGAITLGGTWAMDEPTIDHLRALGWLTPAQSRAEYGKITPNFEVYAELDAAESLAHLLVASLQVLDVHPTHLELITSGSGNARVSG